MFPKVGFVAVGSPLEAGFELAEERMKKAVENLKKYAEVVCVEDVVASRADNVRAIERLKEENVDLLGIMVCTWIHDDILLNMIYGLDVPVVLWSLPYPETVSMGCVQHIASVLRTDRVHYRYVYGKETDSELAKKIGAVAKVARVAKELRGLRIGQIGPRPMWRITGPTDTTFDEINLSRIVGSQIVHIETSELLSVINEISDAEARDVLGVMRKAGKLDGRVEVKEPALLRATKSYIALKKIAKKYSLNAITVQCYPGYVGLVCFAFSQLGEEGMAVGCEGDVVSTVLVYVLQRLTGKPATITEPVSIEEDKGTIILRHCGAAAPTFAASPEEIHLSPVSPEEGITVQFPVKPNSPATIACIWGREKLNMFIASAKTKKIDVGDWSRMGRAFLIRVKPNSEEDIRITLDKIIQEKAIDHHWVIVLDDVKEDLKELAHILKMNIVNII